MKHDTAKKEALNMIRQKVEGIQFVENAYIAMKKSGLNIHDHNIVRQLNELYNLLEILKTCDEAVATKIIELIKAQSCPYATKVDSYFYDARFILE